MICRLSREIAVILIALTLFSVACRSSDTSEPAGVIPESPAVKPTIRETVTSKETNIDSKTPAAPKSEFPLPSPSVAPVKVPNLKPFVPPGWYGPLLITNQLDAFASTLLTSDGPIYISWAISNQGEVSSSEFVVDLLLDGIPIERWSTEGLERGGTRITREWDKTRSRSRISAGEHLLQVVVDSTDLISESNENDNVYSIKFNWPQTSEDGRIADSKTSRLPNIAPYTPPGWEHPIQISYPTTPSRDAPSIRIAYRNKGLSSISQLVQVYLYLDGILVATFRQRDLIAGEAVLTPPWAGLGEIIRYSPGRHTFKVVVDPTNLIEETVEEDNVFSTVSSPNETLPTTSPTSESINRMYSAFSPPGWSSPVIITNFPGLFRKSESLIASQQAYAHWAIRTPDTQTLQSPYTVELSLDDNVIGEWSRLGADSNSIDFVLDWPLPLDITPGIHTVSLVIRYANESGRATFATVSQLDILATGRLSQSETKSISDREIRSKLALLEPLLSSDATNSSEAGDSIDNALITVVDAVYYSLYIKSLTEESLSIHILSDADYTSWTHIHCKDLLENAPVSLLAYYQDSCLNLQRVIGFTTKWRGQYHIVVHGERPPIQVLSTIAHELGHFRQEILKPDKTVGVPSQNRLAFREAQAYSYQVFFLRTLADLTAQDLLSYPLLNGYSNFIERQINFWLSTVQSDEHSAGHVIQWSAILTDPNLRATRTILLDQRRLTTAAAQEVFKYLALFAEADIDRYVTKLLQDARNQLPAMKSIANSRLISGLPYWNEGSPYLREVGLLIP
jgi:hypothetical protein